MKLIRSGIGIDVGGTKIWAALGTEDGRIVDEIKLDTEKAADAFFSQLNDIVRRLSQRAERAGLDRPRAVGIGLPGRVSGGRVVWVPNLPSLDGVDLGAHAAAHWGVPVRLGNDGQLALYGEHWLGAARGCNSVLMMTIGTGIGGAVLLDGKLWSGHTGTAGSMGWLTLDPDDAGDAELGWLERHASGSAVNRRARELAVPRDSRGLFAAAAAGDEEAGRLVAEIGRRLGSAIAGLVSVFDPELFLIGGGLSAQLDQLLPSLREALARQASPATRHVPVVAARLLDRAGVLGALRLSFD